MAGACETFGLAKLVERSFPDFGAGASTLRIAMKTLHELVGPVLARRARISSRETHLEEHGVQKRDFSDRPAFGSRRDLLSSNGGQCACSGRREESMSRAG